MNQLALQVAKPGSRVATVQRKTRETSIEVALELDGDRSIQIQTGLGFFDHMLTALAFHAKWNLKLIAKGDLHVDDHHTVEDCGLLLGEAFAKALGDKRGIRRFAAAFAPLDEALARTVIDLSDRPSSVIELELKREMLGNVACENLVHFFQSFATTGKITLHIDVLRGNNDHHRVEAAFKSCALALREAAAIETTNDVSDTTIPSTKGTL